MLARDPIFQPDVMHDPQENSLCVNHYSLKAPGIVNSVVDEGLLPFEMISGLCLEGDKGIGVVDMAGYSNEKQV